MAASIFVDPCIKRNHRKVSRMRGKAETSYLLVVAGRAPRGVMLLGTTETITAKPTKVKYFSTGGVAAIVLKGSCTPPEEIMDTSSASEAEESTQALSSASSGTKSAPGLWRVERRANKAGGTR